MKERTRTKFDKAFKLMAVELHKRGKSIGEIALYLYIATDLVRRLCRVYAATGEGSFAGNGIPVFTPEQREISLLNKALK
jgi:transposase